MVCPSPTHRLRSKLNSSNTKAQNLRSGFPDIFRRSPRRHGDKMNDHIKNALLRYPALEACAADIYAATDALCEMYFSGGKLLLCGNGGSAADCEHISGELLKGFLLKRPLDKQELDVPFYQKLQKGIPAVPLTSLSSSLTAFANDVDASLMFAQLVLALGKKEDIFFGISTSGNSASVVAAAETAKALGIKTVCLVGEKGGKLSEICDIAIKAPATETFEVQEYHLPIYHAICAQAEEKIFG